MTDDARELVGRLYERVLNGGQMDAIDDLFTDEYDEHDPLPGQRTGREGVRDRVQMLRDALAPRFTVEDVVAENDRVVVRWSQNGTHSGELFGIPPTGTTFTIAGIDVYRVEGGRFAEHWHVVDQLALLQQLGVIPAPGEGGGDAG